MSIRTALTEKFGLQYPIVSAPMGSVAGGRLAAAVSNAGALGLVGGGYGDPDWLRAELSTARSETTRPWGVGLITWHATHEIVELALSYEPRHPANAGLRHCASARVAPALHRSRHTQSVYGTLGRKGG